MNTYDDGQRTNNIEQLDSIKGYWTLRADGYSQSINECLENGESDNWIAKISKYVDLSKKLRVLDIGTGPGFFPIVLGKMGHDITAIDCTEAMLEIAKKNCQRYGVDVKFMKMDAQKLEFSENSFDLIICRNLVWNLEHPKKAYMEWLKVLDKDGRILIFDGNHYLQLFDENYASTLKDSGVKNEHRYIQNVDTRIMLEIAKKLPLSKQRRPQWDVNTFIEMGSNDVQVSAESDNMMCFIEDDEVKHIPLNFTVCAIK